MPSNTLSNVRAPAQVAYRNLHFFRGSLSRTFDRGSSKRTTVRRSHAILREDSLTAFRTPGNGPAMGPS